jgi:hypothetical protein
MTTDSLAQPLPQRRLALSVFTPRRTSYLPPGWPLAATLCLYPLWWVLGLSQQIFLFTAIPMIVHLVRNRPIRVPPGFLIWSVFLAWVVVCTVTIGDNPLGTVPGVFSHRLLNVLLRIGQIAAATVTLLYIGNLPPGVTQRKVLKWLAFLCVTTVAGGVLGMVAPHFQFASPLAHLVPAHLRSNRFIHNQLYASAAQLQTVPGLPTGRPAAPYTFTNTWGNCLSVLLIWLVVYGRMTRHRGRVVLLTVIALAPILYSLNRGMWLGMLAIVIYTALRAALHGHRRLLGGLFIGLILAMMAVVATPMHSLITTRLHNGDSNDIRRYTSVQAFKFAETSPIVGYGTTRSIQGGEASITIGRSTSCPRCGNPVLGENGEFWAVIVSNGFVGGALYLGFFLFGIVRFWRDRTPVGIAGVGVLFLAVAYSFIYNAVGIPLCLYMISYALLWTNSMPRTPPAAKRAGELPALAQ